MTTNAANWPDSLRYKKDPFPDIESALLNSQDIRRYIDEGLPHRKR